LVLRIDYEKTSVLLTADIEGEAEMNLVNSGLPLKADVLKIGHHGGNTSTCEAFLKAVDPQYAVISVGKGNKHGHPHPEPLSNLEKKNVTVYRTDLFGTIVGTSDGEKWTFEVSKAR
jgi:beta-lactamase superfamily II metal-dependent hydrolase